MKVLDLITEINKLKGEIKEKKRLLAQELKINNDVDIDWEYIDILVKEVREVKSQIDAIEEMEVNNDR